MNTTDIVKLLEDRPIEFVGLDDINTASWNPPARVTPQALAELRNQIEAVGGILQPLILARGDILADGHRRLAVARELGYQRVPVRRLHEFEPDELWARLNAGTLSVSKKTWGQAVRYGLTTEVVPLSTKNQIAELIRLLGKRRYDDLIDNKRSPGILYWAVRLSRYCEDDSDKWIKSCLIWLDDHNQQLNVRIAMQQSCPPETIIRAVKENRPLQRYWGVG